MNMVHNAGGGGETRCDEGTKVQRRRLKKK